MGSDPSFLRSGYPLPQHISAQNDRGRTTLGGSSSPDVTGAEADKEGQAVQSSTSLGCSQRVS